MTFTIPPDELPPRASAVVTAEPAAAARSFTSASDSGVDEVSAGSDAGFLAMSPHLGGDYVPFVKSWGAVVSL